MQKSFSILTDVIEYYDQNKDPIRGYFVEKLQILMSNRKVNILLEQAWSQETLTNKNTLSDLNLKERKKIR